MHETLVNRPKTTATHAEHCFPEREILSFHLLRSYIMSLNVYGTTHKLRRPPKIGGGYLRDEDVQDDGSRRFLKEDVNQHPWGQTNKTH
jgi:hypothetical protein